jgi:chromosome partitioning protein
MRVIGIVNQKGGCGKTTTTVNLAGSLAADGARVLVVDLDPQAHATLALGVDPEDLEENLYEVLIDPYSADRLQEVLVQGGGDIAIAPSGIVLSALEQRLASAKIESRTDRLANALESVQGMFDYALIDCPPNVGLLTFNALRAADEVIVPLEMSYFAIHGVQKLIETIALLSERVSHDLQVRILPTLYDGRTRHARQTLAEVREMYKDLCFDTVIRLNVKLREAANRGLPICAFAPSANGSRDYNALAVEVEASDPSFADASLGGEIDLTTDPVREVVVQFRDAGANDVRIAGDFNGWIPDKGVRSLIESEGSERVWTKIIQLPPGTYEYRYVVDGEWRKDPQNPEFDSGSAGGRNSILVVR